MNINYSMVFLFGSLENPCKQVFLFQMEKYNNLAYEVTCLIVLIFLTYLILRSFELSDKKHGHYMAI